MGFLGKRFGNKEKKEPNDLRAALLNKIEVYAEAMQYLATCAHFDASKFERLDEILSKAGASLGPEKRREMLSQSQYILPHRTTGGVEELGTTLLKTLAEGFKAFTEILYKISPTPETVREVKRIVDKYKT
jgi:hypothetical protein